MSKDRFNQFKDKAMELLHIKKVSKDTKAPIRVKPEPVVSQEEKDTYCYYIDEKDALIIGTRKELTASVKNVGGIQNLNVQTYNKIEASTKIINDSLKKSITATVAGKTSNKLESDYGTATLDAEFEAKAEALVDLTKLLVELGVKASAKVSVSIKSKEFNLGGVTIQAFLEAEATAMACAKLQINPKGILLEAKAVAEAKASIGTSFKSPTLGKSDYKIELKPSLTAYARAEAKASLAAGLTKEGGQAKVSLGASAAVGLRGTLEVSLLGTATIIEKDEIAHTKRTVEIKDAALGTIAVEVELELAVGVEVEVSPLNLKKETDPKTGLAYAVGEGNIKIDLPVAFGAAGVGCGIRISVKILYDILEKAYNKIKAKIIAYVMDKVGNMVKEKFTEMVTEAEIFAEELKASSSKYVAALADLLGMHAEAVKLAMVSQEQSLVEAFNDLVAENSPETKDYLKNRFEKYHTFLSKSFTKSEEQINKVISDLNPQIAKVKQGGGDATEVLAKLKVKVNGVLTTMKLISDTEQRLAATAEETTKLGSGIIDPALLKEIKAKSSSMGLLVGYAENILKSL